MWDVKAFPSEPVPPVINIDLFSIKFIIMAFIFGSYFGVCCLVKLFDSKQGMFCNAGGSIHEKIYKPNTISLKIY
jgi:hypothetical protein